MPKGSRLLLFLIPGAIFMLVLAAFIAKIPKKETATTENNPMPTMKVVSTPIQTNVSPLQSYINSVSALQVDDPQLTPPNYDRKIFLPAEK